MNDEKKKVNFVKYAIIGTGGAIVLLIALYFFITGSYFLKEFILPKCSAFINGKITADEIYLSPFKKVKIKNLSVTGTDGKTVVNAGLVTAEYDLWKILKGNIEIKSVTIESPVVNLEIADGKNNLEALMKESKSGGTQGKETLSAPLILNLGEFNVSNGKINLILKQSNEVVQAGIKDLNLKTTGIKNSGIASITLSGLWDIIIGTLTNKSVISGNTKLNIDLSLNNELMPLEAKGNLDLNIEKTSGDFATYSNIAAKIEMDVNQNETKKFNLRFVRNNEDLGVASITSKHDLKTKNANLKININKISGSVLSLAAAKSGIEILSPGLNGVIELIIENGGNSLTTRGELNCDKLQISRADLKTPVIDSRLKFDLSADLLKSNAIIRALDLNISQMAKPLILFQLSRELTFNWGTSGEALKESEVIFKISDFDVANWRSVIGTNIQSGVINLDAKGNIKNDGKYVDFLVQGNLHNINAIIDSNKISNADISIDVSGNIIDFEKLNLNKSQLLLSLDSQKALNISANGTVNIKDITLKINLQTEADIPGLLTLFPKIENTSIKSGKVSFKGDISKDLKSQQGITNKIEIFGAKGDFILENLSGILLSNKIEAISALAKFDILKEGANISINNSALTLKSKNKDCGDIVAIGNVNLNNYATTLSFKISNLNQEILKPFAGQYLNNRELKNIEIFANLNTDFHPQKDSKISGDFNVKQLIVEDPAKIIPSKPIDIISQLDISISSKKVADIRKLNVNFRQEGKPAGSIELSGRHDLLNNAGQIELTLNDINQEGIAPLIPPISNIGSVKTLSINGSITANYDLKRKSELHGGIQITNLVIVSTNGSLVSNPLSFILDLSGEMESNGLINIKKFSGNILEGNNPAGNIDLTLSYETNKGNATVSLKIDKLNQNALKIAVNPYLHSKTLKQVVVNANISADYKSAGESKINGNIKLTGLQIEDPKKKSITEPLDFELTADTILSKNALDLKKITLGLTPTDKATNILETSGKIDFSLSNIYAGAIQITSDSVDLTKLYALVNELSMAEEDKSKEKSKESKKQSSNIEAEPAPITLPLSNFVFNANIRKLCLNEIQIDNLQTTAKIDRTLIEVNPFKLTFNSAPVDMRTKLNLGLPGYQYDMFMKIAGLPLSPIITSLKPDLKLTSGGEIYSELTVNGKGTTGKSLKENLNGYVTVSLTNANIVMMSGTAKVILSPIAFILGIPEIVNSPIQSADANITLGSGKIDIKKLVVQSPVFMVETSGAIPIEDVLTNSPLDLPVVISLKQEYAKRFSLQNQGEEYVKLPQFATVKGTIGSPDVKIDKLKIAAITAVGIGTATGNRAGNIIRNFTNIITGDTKSTNQIDKATTNAPPASPQPLAPVKNLFNIFKRQTN